MINQYTSRDPNYVTSHHVLCFEQYLQFMHTTDLLQYKKGIPLFDKGILDLQVAKFESKVGSRRTTKIWNLVVLDTYLVALILIPYRPNMQFFLSS